MMHNNRHQGTPVSTPPRFDYCISNPPYQLDNQSATASRRTTTDIFPDFQRYASVLAPVTALIYPATWQKTITTGLGLFLREHGVRQVDQASSNNVFPNITAGYPLSIVITEEGWGGDVCVNGRNRDRNLPVWLDNEAQRILFEKVSAWPKLPAGLTNLTNLSNVADSGLAFADTVDGLDNPVSIYIKARPGVQSDAAVRFIARADLAPALLDPDTLDRYAVAIRSAPVGRMRFFRELVDTHKTLGAQVFGPGEGYGLTWLTVKCFDTAETASNFANFVNTRFYITLVSLDITRVNWGRYVPDLGDWTNNNLVFAPDDDLPANHPYRGLDLDHRLYALFRLSAEEQVVVETGR